ncbi:D-alanine--D-alanine ligase [Lapidilactobacillus concavus DSM 17758]|uniref:D-alanine--D-alanine ligase n=1 Tax=Lapidilactobacillus concavus DSM 17758 TaxID=1423735 RepID=A0A0R1VSC4_9LACO|nr:D-alanine--D-alanine ligase family protein [Lapidilactobacillus concavus]KRM08656.1 D-alanine--D-alanine ligase [Lapidilactobacillus concavus DSM 17758]GEL13123.1 D-alanine--D-alanine ligase B [Lapidilactobacillus concavus]
MKLYLMYGGRTVEHDVTIMSTHSALEAIDYSKYEVIPVYITHEGQFIKGLPITAPVDADQALKMDVAEEASWRQEPAHSFGTRFELEELANAKDTVVFPMIHGTYGEDGTIQGLLEVLDVPYVGAEIRASAVAMDKIMSKIIFDEFGIPQVPYLPVLATDYQTVTDHELLFAKVTDKLGYPVYVKPANAGSSIGITKVDDQSQLEAALALAFKYDNRVIIEKGIKNARELAVGLLGNEQPRASIAGEIGKKQEFYDYESKFVDGSTKLIIPASISAEQLAAVQKYSILAFNAVGASGLTRADFFLDADGAVYLNEIQTLPGFTKFSMYPYLWQASGVSYPELIDDLIKLGLERYQAKKAIAANL